MVGLRREEAEEEDDKEETDRGRLVGLLNPESSSRGDSFASYDNLLDEFESDEDDELEDWALSVGCC